MALMYGSSSRRFGELLIKHGRIDAQQLSQALESRQGARERIGQTLVRLGLLDESDVARFLAEQFSLPLADADRLAKADLQAVQLVPEHLARQAGLLALRRNGHTLDLDRKSTRLNSSHIQKSRMPSSA